MARARTTLLPSIAAIAFAVALCNSCLSFVGIPAQHRGSDSLVARKVGTDYLLRHGPKDSDPPPVDTSRVSGATYEVEYKKRPFGIDRYAPGVGGKGAVVMDVTQKSRYPGDPLGQAFVAGTQPGWMVKSINGQDVTSMPIEEIMQRLDDEVLDPVTAMSLNLKATGVQTDLMNDGTDRVQGTKYAITSHLDDIAPVEMPVKIVYQATSGSGGASAPAASYSAPAPAPYSAPAPAYSSPAPAYSPPPAAPKAAGDYSVSDADIERFYQEITSGNGGDAPKGTIVAELIVKFFHGEFTPQGFKRYSGMWKGPPPGSIGKKDIAVGMESFKQQMRNPMFVSKGGVGYGVDESQKVVDDGKGWVWLAAEMSPGGLAVEMFTSVPYGKRALLVAKRNNVDELFAKVNWNVAVANIDKTLGGPQVKQR